MEALEHMPSDPNARAREEQAQRDLRPLEQMPSIPSYRLRRVYHAGQVFREETMTSMPAMETVAKIGGATISGKGRLTEKRKRIVSILSVDVSGWPTTFRVSHSRKTTIALSAEGDPDEIQEVTDPLDGEAVLFERTDGSWRKTLVGKEPTDEQVAALSYYPSPFDQEAIIAPARLVSIGESWVVEGENLRRYLGPHVTEAKGRLTITLEAIGPAEGERVARLVGVMDASGAGIDEQNREGRFTWSMKYTMQRSLESLSETIVGEGIFGKASRREDNEQSSLFTSRSSCKYSKSIIDPSP